MSDTEELAALRERVKAVLDCSGSMCGHCIEILTEEIPPMTLEEYNEPGPTQ